MTDQRTVEQCVIDAAGERLTALRTSGDPDVETLLSISALESIAGCEPDDLRSTLDAVFEVLLDGERLGRHGNGPVGEVMGLRVRLHGAHPSAGDLGGDYCLPR